MRTAPQTLDPEKAAQLTQLHKDAVDVVLGNFNVDARVDGVSCCLDVIFDVMMIGDDTFQRTLVTDDVASEIP